MHVGQPLKAPCTIFLRLFRLKAFGQNTACRVFLWCQKQVNGVRGKLSSSCTQSFLDFQVLPSAGRHKAPAPWLAAHPPLSQQAGATSLLGTPAGTTAQDWHQGYVVQCSRSGTGFIGLAKTDEKRKKERNSGVGGDAVAAPSALRLGAARRVKQQRHLAGGGVKPICNTSPGL